MVSMIDILDNGFSSVYTFFDPVAAGSLGSYGILWQLEQCRELGLPWLYLGYWIRESRKMSYKSSYQPFQILRNGVWAEPEGITSYSHHVPVIQYLFAGPTGPVFAGR